MAQEGLKIPGGTCPLPPYFLRLCLAISDCMPHPTPIDNLFVLAGIIPFELRRKRATLSLARRAIDPEHLLHDRLLFT